MCPCVMCLEENIDDQQITEEMVWDGEVRRINGYYYGRVWWVNTRVF